MTALAQLLDTYRRAAHSQREKGTYFEELVKTYLINEPSYRDLFAGQVYLWEEWRRHQAKQGHADPGPDAGIDLVAVEAVAQNPRVFAVQAKFYAEDSTISKAAGIDSFLSAMGKPPFTNGLLMLTTHKATQHVTALLQGRDKPVNIITLSDLEGSLIDWSRYQPATQPVMRARKSLRPHQQAAFADVVEGLGAAERGKLIMACGTGKTFTSLKIAEQIAGAGGRVLFLMPSLALLSQTLTEWTQESATLLHSFAVCSDAHVGKQRADDDRLQIFTHELRYPATTDAASLAREMGQRHDDRHMSVVFSTYHSIDVVSKAQLEQGLPAFDLIICDEAHRTTGAIFDGDESAFVRVHNEAFIHASRRLYMTATPRIYGDAAKAKAEEGAIALCSMDDEAIYGKTLHTLTFSEAVERNLLVDYKVLVLTVEESIVNQRLQRLLSDADNSLKVDDAAKIVGCWKALSKQGMAEQLAGDPEPMRRAVAFCQVIEAGNRGRTHKVSSKQIAKMFEHVVDAYQKAEREAAEAQGIELDDAVQLKCKAKHVDGSMDAEKKKAKLEWLKGEEDGTCRILSNVRCLSEGVDVPALDAVLFLTARNSQVDVVQSVGRVMRRAPGKTRGYVILPVVIPAGVPAHEALNDNRTYRVVWQVLNALRSHDDRFDAMINKLDLIGRDPDRMEVIAVSNTLPQKPTKAGGTKNKQAGRGQTNIGQAERHGPTAEQAQQALPFEVTDLERAIYAKLVDKVGNRHHWEDWATDIAKIARTHIDRIEALLKDPANVAEREAFEAFATELRDDLNASISNAEIIEMLAQHLITRPVFEALFEGYDFARSNPISRTLQKVLDTLQEHHLDKEADTLAGFYRSVKLRAQGIDSAAGRQKIIVELYDKFFRNAFKRMTDRLGIVYTPVEVVDFILHSVNHLLHQEFGQTLGSPGVHIIDPFTGTGTFITRLLQSGLIKPEELAHKYRHEIHANEIVLLAYYIAAINIESAFHDLVGGEYVPFEGICLTDTFQMYESEDMIDALLVENSERRKRQKALDIRVIVANPPYSIGQGNANDNNANVSYPGLDRHIEKTYAARSDATLSKGLYDSYIRAIRWASDRIGDAGVIGFVTNAGYLDAGSADGLRKCLAEEFASIYVLHLRGNQRTSGEQSRREGGKIFGSGSRAPIAISLMVKNPDAVEHGQIYFHDIGDYLSREEKLAHIADFGSIEGVTGWRRIMPDAHGDWLDQRDDSFKQFIVLGAKGSDETPLFSNYSLGVSTNRDAWVYNASRAKVEANMERMIAFYNSEVERFNAAHIGLGTKARRDKINDFIDADPEQISWTRSLKQELIKGRKFSFEAAAPIESLYRPFTKRWLYFDRVFNEMVLQMPRIFPHAGAENLVIQATGGAGARSFSVLISDTLPCLDNIEKGQCFPLYLYDEKAEKGGSGGALFDSNDTGAPRRDAITDEGLAHFQEAYPGELITKEDLFYYIYGLLHSLDYRARYAANLSKELPRIPRVKAAIDFRTFSKAGRDLATLHLNYETVEPYPLTIAIKGELTDASYRVVKMKFAKKRDPETGKNIDDHSTVIYNSKITLRDIPERAWEYIVNGKPALQWVMERQTVKTDKASGITNDANDWAIETMHNVRYPLELFQRVVTVSLETLKIVEALPALDVAPHVAT